mmetsp:Transcript_40882/g.76054  ORF Transcript_40882/g.76054 Transcript_40882/m.76054 type:complete len:86 (+) Transcript_40882:294-551(+)
MLSEYYRAFSKFDENDGGCHGRHFTWFFRAPQMRRVFSHRLQKIAPPQRQHMSTSSATSTSLFKTSRTDTEATDAQLLASDCFGA